MVNKSHKKAYRIFGSFSRHFFSLLLASQQLFFGGPAGSFIFFIEVSMKPSRKTPKLLGLAAAFMMVASTASALPIGWSAEGNADLFTPNGVVTSLPGVSTYYYVSTAGGPTGVGQLPGIGGTNGSTLTSPIFAANMGSQLEFNFNYVTSDGAGFADYAWAQVVNAADPTETILLFTARTTPGGDTVPGFGLPPIDPGVTLEPPSTPIIPGGPLWAQLGGSSGSCYSTGCGYTGWVKATYEFAQAGNFQLQFGVSNFLDQIYHSGMAISGTTIDGVPIDPIPLPAAGWLLLGGMGALIAVRRRKKTA